MLVNFLPHARCTTHLVVLYLRSFMEACNDSRVTLQLPIYSRQGRTQHLDQPAMTPEGPTLILQGHLMNWLGPLYRACCWSIELGAGGAGERRSGGAGVVRDQG